MSMPSDEYLHTVQHKLLAIEQEISGVVTDIALYLGSRRNTENDDRLIKSLRDMQEVMAEGWPPQAPPIITTRLTASDIITRGGLMHTTDEIRYNCGSHAVLISPGSIDGPPPFKVKVWLNADKGNTPYNPAFLEIKSSREFKTRGAAYEYGSHLCRRTNEKSA